MGLDAYLYYQCPFRPNGDLTQLQEFQRMSQMLGVMRQHGVPSVTFQMRGPQGVTERTVSREEAEASAAQAQNLSATCARCPVGTERPSPGCLARVNYPIDENALHVLHEALEINAADFTPPRDAFIRSLVKAPEVNGERMARICADLQATPSPVGSSPVTFVIEGQTHAVTPHMVLEHLFFRRFLDQAETLAIREWFRSFYSAIGNRIMDGPGDQQANTKALFTSSPSLQDLAALGNLIKRAETHGLALMMDG